MGTDQRAHRPCADILGDATSLVISPFVLAELDCLLRQRIGQAAELIFLGEIATGAYEPAQIGADDIDTCRRVIDHYRDLDLGLTEASLIVLAHRHRTHDLFTLDERHFRNVAALDGRPFRLLPADA